jgi:phosphohistidine phosphatase
MRSLILFRHGKSDWDAPYGSDHERPLAHRGKEAAICMGRMLSQAGQAPDLAVSSSALSV